MKKRKNNKNYLLLLIISFIILTLYGIGKNIYNNINDISKIDNNSSINVDISNVLQIYYLDVGQADSILIRLNNHNMLIDAGNNADGPLLVNYFKTLGITTFDYVIGTHAHEDHIGGLDDIIKSFTINNFYMPDALTTTKTYENILDALYDQNVTYKTPKINDTFKLDNSTITILYTGTNTNDLNDSSIVLKLTYDQTSYLFMGDASISVEKKIINKNIKADVIKIGHHGSKTSTNIDFLNKVNPQDAIISVGIDNKYKHPSIETITKLNEKNINIYRTDELGTILLTSDGKNINYQYIKTEVNG